MWILPCKNEPVGCYQLLDKVIVATNRSRFTVCTEISHLQERPGVKVYQVRLRTKKGYCGAHPGPCLATVERKVKRATYLEGLDWVGFNTMLNDAFDDANIACDIFSFNRESFVSGRYYIRLGRQRRVAYPYSFDGRVAHWTQTKQDKVDCFEDHCGKPHPPIAEMLAVLEGTPGYPCYTLEDEAKYKLLETHEGH